MTKRLLDFNPLSGEKVWFQYDQSIDSMTITHEQGVSNHLDVAHARSIDDNYTRKGFRNDLWHYAKVPNTVILQMKQEDGVDLFDKNDAKRVFELLNTKYKRFKTTSKTHNVRNR
jgi:hypothetical protein